MGRLTLAPVWSRISQAVLGYRPLEDLAADTVVVCPEETAELAPPIHLPHQLGLIRGVHEFSAGLDDELRLATEPVGIHQETIAYRLSSVALVKGRLCKARSHKALTFRRTYPAPRWLDQTLDTGALASSNAGNDYFAHFLLDDIATMRLAQQFSSVVTASLGAPRTAHSQQYLDEFSLQPRDLEVAFFKELWVFRDFPQNSHRRRRLRALAGELNCRYGGARAGVPPVFIRRGTHGAARLLTNEPEVLDYLLGRGFQIIDPDTSSVSEMCSMLNGSPLALGVEGSQLA
ncbi:MAG: glycosyltransferase family 61 protein, partial [Gammaproteobacteria bacterium]|nr:glycosyltransferase family 61 protein [Gammaproteobacteria bacterium]